MVEQHTKIGKSFKKSVRDKEKEIDHYEHQLIVTPSFNNLTLIDRSIEIA
jgi:hypothetical protein